MNQVVVFYNPFLPELKISVNGKKLSPYSSLMSFQHQRLEKWSDCLFSELYREVNSDYEMFCVSNEFTCEWLEELANRNAHCISFVSQALPRRRPNDGNVFLVGLVYIWLQPKEATKLRRNFTNLSSVTYVRLTRMDY